MKRYIVFCVNLLMVLALSAQSRLLSGAPENVEAVDLGLPSGTRWASCNVGASSPEEYGGYYSWGETEEKDDYSWNNYSYLETYEKFDGYTRIICKDIGDHISGTQYDVAHVKWGGEWRLPTKSEMDELLEYCIAEVTIYNDVKVMKFIGPSGKSVFFPFPGAYFHDDGEFVNEGFFTMCWSGDLASNATPWALAIYSDNNNWVGRYSSNAGFSVRPVMSVLPTDPRTYIDLGLPSGTKWANMNVGASRPEEYGEYFAWGETSAKDSYSWENYMCTEATCGKPGDPVYDLVGDKADIAGTKFDAATINWGASWNMPTAEQVEELASNCYSSLVTINGVACRKLKSRINGNEIIFPLAGARWFENFAYEGSLGYYWSSTLRQGGYVSPCRLIVRDDAHGWGWSMGGENDRFSGFPIRPVYVKNAQGGKGVFATNYDVNGQDEIYISKGISFVRDGQADRYAWRPFELQQEDFGSLGELFDIKNVKSIFRHVESDNQFFVDLPPDAPVTPQEVIVQAYGEEIAPTEQNIYCTGANSVSVLNKNGKIIYDCYISVDTLNAQRTIEVNALETAYSMLVPLFPFALDPAPDDILLTLKTLLAELPETHALAAAIDRSVVKNGYLEIADIDTEFRAAVDCIIDKLGLRDNYLKQSSNIRQRRIGNLPSVINGKSVYGLELKLDNSEWHDNGEMKWWQCFFTAYNSNRFAYTAWTKGFKDSDGYAHLYDIDYRLLKDRILKPQRVSTFMKNFTTWDGLKNYWGDTYDLLFTEGFGFDDMTWDCTSKSFDMNFYSPNEIVVVLGPADDDGMFLYNLTRTFLDPILKKVGKGIADDNDFMMNFIVDLITDANYMYEFHHIVKGNNSFSVNAKEFVKLTWPKLKDHLIDYFKEELDTKALQYVWDKWGFMAAVDIQKAFDAIDDNWNLWLKKVEFWGDMFLGDIGLFEGNCYYNLDLDFNVEQAPSYKESFTVNGVKFDMVWVEGSTYEMGAVDNDKEASESEKPRHKVTVSNFFMGETEVTQALWQAVMGNNPSHFNGTQLPVENVSWLDCQEFITKLNTLTGRNFRFPTEAEWEYAARGGLYSLGYKYSGSHDLNTVGWYEENSEKGTHPVRWKKANELGLYDMSGNVFEWCQDYYDANYYNHSHSINPEVDPCNDVVATLYARVLRGGCWHWKSKYCRVSSRSSNGQGVKSEIIGLRLALSDEASPITYLSCPDDHHPHLIDLGLPSRTLWACCNTRAEKPENYGNYYAWGEPTGFDGGKTSFTWKNYKYCRGSSNTLTKYCTKSYYGFNGFTDDKTELETSDYPTAFGDNDYNIPSKSDWEELINCCTWTRVENGVRVVGPNQSSIILPLSGYRQGLNLYDAGTDGYYWSSTLDENSPDDAWFLYVGSNEQKSFDYYRCSGRSIRPVYLRKGSGAPRTTESTQFDAMSADKSEKTYSSDGLIVKCVSRSVEINNK